MIEELMMGIRDVPDDHSETVSERFAVPLNVRLQIAESKKKMAESRYRLSVNRARSWADKPIHTTGGGSVDSQ